MKIREYKPSDKKQIKEAIFAMYKVKPVKVNMLAVPKRPTSFKGKSGVHMGGKKALVYLKEGDKIEFI